MKCYLALLVVLLIFAFPSECIEIAYISGPNGETPVGYANITEYEGNDAVSFATSASPRGPSTSYKTKQRTVDDIKDEINMKINRGNAEVRTRGLKLAAGRSGAQRIDQICSIYDYMLDNWSFVSDWRGMDQFQFSNFTLEIGEEEGVSGAGDCDDFSILLSALIESIGGTPRIILAYSPSGGHAYTEVYLGKNNSIDVERMKKWLRNEYQVDNIYIHSDPENGDVWLNMDWWKDPNTGEEDPNTGEDFAIHPGGPFFHATSQVPLYIQEETEKSPLTPIENEPPWSSFNYSPLQPEVNEIVCFDAHESYDPDGEIVGYEWDFGDGDTSHKKNSQHVYSEKGIYSSSLTVTDNEGDKSTKTNEINVREPLPEAIWTSSPNPRVGEAIIFDATQSKDKRGQIVRYEWNFDDGESGNKAKMKHQYTDSGTYNVMLTVFNDRGLSNSTTIPVDVSQEVEPRIVPKDEPKDVQVDQEVEQTPSKPEQSDEVEVPKESPPKAVFSYYPTEPKADELVAFDASTSVSNDGKLAYEWDFGDGYSGKGVSISHLYFDSATYEVSLTVTNEKLRSHTSTKTLLIREKESIAPKENVEETPSPAPIPHNPTTVPVEATGSYATVTIRSAQYQGFDVKVDGVLIGSDGKGGDALDGIYSFKVSGNQQHLIRAEHPYNWKWWEYPYYAGESYSYDF